MHRRCAGDGHDQASHRTTGQRDDTERLMALAGRTIPQFALLA